MFVYGMLRTSSWKNMSRMWRSLVYIKIEQIILDISHLDTQSTSDLHMDHQWTVIDLPRELVSELISHLKIDDKINLLVMTGWIHDVAFFGYFQIFLEEYRMMSNELRCSTCDKIGKLKLMECSRCNKKCCCLEIQGNFLLCSKCIKECTICGEKHDIRPCEYCADSKICTPSIRSYACINIRCLHNINVCEKHSSVLCCINCEPCRYDLLDWVRRESCKMKDQLRKLH